MKKKKSKIFSLCVYGILDKKKKKITKVSLIKEEIQLDVDLDNHEGTLSLCSFDLKIKLVI